MQRNSAQGNLQPFPKLSQQKIHAECPHLRDCRLNPVRASTVMAPVPSTSPDIDGEGETGSIAQVRMRGKSIGRYKRWPPSHSAHSGNTMPAKNYKRFNTNAESHQHTPTHTYTYIHTHTLTHTHTHTHTHTPPVSHASSLSRKIDQVDALLACWPLPHLSARRTAVARP